MSCGLAVLLGEGYEKAGEVEAAMKWMKVATDGMQRWMDSRAVGEAEKAKVKDSRDRVQAHLDSLATLAKAEDEEKQQVQVGEE